VAIERAETAGIAVFGIIAGADPAPASAEIALVVDRIRLGCCGPSYGVKARLPRC